MNDAALAVFTKAFVPGAYLVGTFPILRHLPSWLPGAGFKRLMAGWKKIVNRMRDVPFERVLKAMVRLQQPVWTICTGVLTGTVWVRRLKELPSRRLRETCLRRRLATPTLISSRRSNWQETSQLCLTPVCLSLDVVTTGD